MLTDKQINCYFVYLEKQILKKSSKYHVELSQEWANSFPSKPGVYIIFEDKKIVYVGETGHIQGRMWDMLDSRHHQLRRNVGRINFSKIKGYIDADSSSKFPAKIERKLNRWIKDKFKISVLPLRLGRKELEEYIFEKYSPKYNQKGRRKW